MSIDRATLRRELRERRRAIPAANRMAAAEQISSQLLSLPCMTDDGYAAGYWAMDGEIALHVWQLHLGSTLVYCLPVLHEDGRLRFAPWRPGEPLVANRYGIPEPEVANASLLEPEAMHLVVLPLLAFDDRGQRLGMGAGWYDRSFAFRQANEAPPYLIGAAFAMQQVDALGAESWDVPLDAICTERGTFLPSARSP